MRTKLFRSISIASLLASIGLLTAGIFTEKWVVVVYSRDLRPVYRKGLWRECDDFFKRGWECGNVGNRTKWPTKQHIAFFGHLSDTSKTLLQTYLN